jgi:hypothetical protein
MLEDIRGIIFPIAIVGSWLIWTFFSLTRYSDGRLIALFLPFALIVILLEYFIFALARLFVYPIYVILDRKHTYEEMIENIKSKFMLI